MSAPVLRLNADQSRKVIAAARLLDSDKPGEVVAAVNAMTRLLPRGITVPDLIERSLATLSGSTPTVICARETHGFPEPKNARIRRARLSPNLNNWERAFLNDMIDRRNLSAPQEITLNSILAKVERGDA